MKTKTKILKKFAKKHNIKIKSCKKPKKIKHKDLLGLPVFEEALNRSLIKNPYVPKNLQNTIKVVIEFGKVKIEALI